ncbi:TMV resistance protein N-like [Neltuma alba]|uniref:TMV resistance protein N-like n=1 Tax=Neltuma alba TaxID=207710 RepID=UPI0010A55E18|nr:TMV resistance protein N-like [Prosopis alba]
MQQKIKLLEDHIQKSDEELQSYVQFYHDSVMEFQDTVNTLKGESKRRALHEPVEDMPLEFWSLDGWSLEKKISTDDAMLLREKVWKRDRGIRDTYITCKEQSEQEVISAFLRLTFSSTSFYGDDTRLGFTSYLYHALHQSGIHAFLDDEFIRIGENITPALFEAIQESRIAIIVFSENYANSTFCLQELEKILECFKEESRLIYAVFYYVDPSELRRPRGSYAKALARLEKRFKDNRLKVEKWRLALSQAAELKGCHLKPKIANEQECITRITKEIAAKINQQRLHITDYQVGLVPRAKEVISCLDLWSTEEKKMIGIWGAGGIGKSTIARAVYNSIADNFEGSCFLSNVRKHSENPTGLSHLQETLLRTLVKEKDLRLGDYHEGIPIIEHRLSKRKILLILDDVDKSEQLKALAGSSNWFGCGSRIIITTRNKKLLVSHGVTSIYDVKELDDKESLKLLSWHAFEKENMDSNYIEACNRAINYSCGFPLVLEVIGSNLRGEGVNLWNSALDQFKSIPHESILGAFKLSYDTLEEVEKQVFLDLACFFNGEKLALVNDMLQSVRGIRLEYAIKVLIDKSLIKIERDCVTIHDLIEDTGKEIVRQESPYEPGGRSRLWFYKDILHVLQQDTGTHQIEAIVLDLPEIIEIQWSGEAFTKMKNLKMLVIRKACFSECPKFIVNCSNHLTRHFTI